MCELYNYHYMGIEQKLAELVLQQCSTTINGYYLSGHET